MLEGKRGRKRMKKEGEGRRVEEKEERGGKTKLEIRVSKGQKGREEERGK